MAMLADFPRFDVALPALAGFIRDMTRRIQLHEIDTTGKAERLIDDFFTAEQLNRLDEVALGWSELNDYDGRKTLYHVITALASLPFYPEYNNASTLQQTMISWAVLYHDIAKRSAFEKDCSHSFRSAVIAAQSLQLTGVALPETYYTDLESWSELTLKAVKGSKVDNQSLPVIMDQLDSMLGQHSASNRIVKIILLHHSIDILKDWPQSDPLSETEVMQMFDVELLQLMRIMLLADSDGWELFHADTCQHYRVETRAVFDRLQKLIAA